MRSARGVVHQQVRQHHEQLRSGAGLRRMRRRAHVHLECVRVRPHSRHDDVRWKRLRDGREQLRTNHRVRRQWCVRAERGSLPVKRHVLYAEQWRGVQQPVRKRHRVEQLRPDGRLSGAVRGRTGLHRNDLLCARQRGGVRRKGLRPGHQQLRSGDQLPQHLRGAEQLRSGRRGTERLRMHPRRSLYEPVWFAQK